MADQPPIAVQATTVNAPQLPAAPAPEATPVMATLFAPWRFLGRPALAAQRLLQASRLAFLLTFVAHLLLLSMTSVWLMVVFARQTYAQLDRNAQWLSFGEAWHEMMVQRGLLPAVGVVLLTVALALPVIGFVAWLLLPSIHRQGSVRVSFARAIRIITAEAALLNLAFGYAAFAIALLALAIWPSVPLPFVMSPIALVLGLALVWIIILWLTRAARAVVDDVPLSAPPPRCEDCGYDLTHRPADDRCPECGLAIEESLTLGRRRKGASWQWTRSPETWISTSLEVLRHPASFYRGIQVRSDDSVNRFARWHYAGIGLAAMIWIIFCIMTAGDAPWEIACIGPLAVLLIVPLAGLVTHRVVAAVAASWSVSTRHLTDVRGIDRVIGYEAAFLWVICLFDGSMITSYMRFDSWVTRQCGLPFVLGMPPELAALLFGSLALCAAWLWRFRIAFDGIRWNNF